MTQKAMREELSQCKNLHELIRAANDLKKRGEDPIAVNKVMQSCRNNLVKQTSSIRRIDKITFQPYPEKMKRCEFNISVEDIMKPVIKYDEVSKVII